MIQQNININQLKKQAVLHMRSGRLQEARDLYNTICRLNKKDVESLYNAGMVNGQLGNFKNAESFARKVIKLQPKHAGAHFILGTALHAQGQYEKAVNSFKKVLRAMPDNAAVYNNLGNALTAQTKITEAIQCYRKAVKLQPNFAEAFNNLGSACLTINKLHEANENFRKAIQINPQVAETYNNLGTVLSSQGHIKEATDAYRMAIQLQPAYHKAHSNLLYLLAASASLPPDEMLDEQKQWDRVHGLAGKQQPLAVHKPLTEPDRRLRIGYVSHDLRTHAVSRFFEPLLAAHDCNRFEIFCYDANANSDDTIKERLRGLAEHWRQVFGINDLELAKLINTDGIDILVDLSGHTQGNRLKAFTYRPAPVQASYLGFFAATGLETIDYWITDEVLHPPDTKEQTVEQIYRLPRCSFCYLPPEEMPAISSVPGNDSQVTFGSFHELSKLTPAVFETWGEILNTLPDSRLLLMEKSLADSQTRQQILERFSQLGISAERLLLKEGAQFAEYLTVYSQIDIVLDSFPRTGGTTTAEALWMGVPVITLAGQRYVERISASKLTTLGLEDLIADSREDYINKALSLARNPTLRSELRATLRKKMTESPLCNGKDLANAMETAYETMTDRNISFAPSSVDKIVSPLSSVNVHPC